MSYPFAKIDRAQVREFARRAGDVGLKIAVRSLVALIRSWPIWKYLYRSGARVAAFAFGMVWLLCLGCNPGFSDFAEQFLDDLRTFFELAARALGGACHFVVFALSRLPPIIGIPTSGLIASWLVYGVIRLARSDRV